MFIRRTGCCEFEGACRLLLSIVVNFSCRQGPRYRISRGIKVAKGIKVKCRGSCVLYCTTQTSRKTVKDDRDDLPTIGDSSLGHLALTPGYLGLGVRAKDSHKVLYITKGYVFTN